MKRPTIRTAISTRGPLVARVGATAADTAAALSTSLRLIIGISLHGGGSDRSLGQNFTVGVRDVDATMPVAAPTTVNIGMGNSSKLDACLSNLRFYRVPQTYMR